MCCSRISFSFTGYGQLGSGSNFCPGHVWLESSFSRDEDVEGGVKDLSQSYRKEHVKSVSCASR